MGDSHAEHWLPAVDRIGRAEHWRVVAMVKPACPVADTPELVNWRLKRQYTECTQWRRAMLRRIVALRPSMVILSSYDHYVSRNGEASEVRVTPAMWRDGLRRTYGILSAAGINTVVIRGTPSPGFDPPSCLSRRASGAPFSAKPCEYDRDAFAGAECGGRAKRCTARTRAHRTHRRERSLLLGPTLSGRAARCHRLS